MRRLPRWIWNLQRVQDELVSKEEVARAIKQARANFAYGMENITNQAFWLGYSEMFSDYDWFLAYLDKLAVSQTKRCATRGTFIFPSAKPRGGNLYSSREG